MATIFHIAGDHAGTGFGTMSGGTSRENKQNTMAYDTYCYDDVKLPGICEQTTSWTATGISGISYSKIGGRIFLRGSISKAWGGSGVTSIGTVAAEARPAKQEQWVIRPAADITVMLQLTTAGALGIVWARNGSSNATGAQTLNIAYEYWA